ncbi:PDZ domain-containing protein [Apilactobacillus quenuiae]|uniref:PDZ domain-containing protein n=1 Tax=Apilactobacillus quenuiae TaxID=2008377 RepID=UPI000D01B347|nr:PDZ domain-containing protein [Apilactobacillus quenuiae]
MNYLLTLSIIFIQPILWLGIIKVILNNKKRISRERNSFNTAIYQNNFELKHFLLGFLIFGVLGSILSTLVGAFISVPWILGYEILLLLNIILIPYRLFPIIIAGITTLITIIPNLSDFINNEFEFSIDLSMTSSQNILFLISLMVLISGFFWRYFVGHYNTPKVSKNKRGNRVAGYILNEMTVFPLLVLIPGDQIQKSISFWPIFMIGHQSFSLFLLPVLLSAKMKIFKNVPRQISNDIGNSIIKIGVLGLAFTVTSYFLPMITLYLIGTIIILYLLILIKHKLQDLKSEKWFSDAVEGVRVIGIRPSTPAYKMGVEIGDRIVEVNDKTVHNEAEFYEAILSSPTFCRLKLINRNDRIKIAESAIYNDSPNELGIVLFK